MRHPISPFSSSATSSFRSCFIVERVWQPSYLVHAALWLPLTLGLTFALMPIVKGAVVGLQWALGMHGFGFEKSNEEESHDQTA